MEPTQNQQQKSVETYAEDMASTLQGGEPGLIKKIIDEQSRKEREKEKASTDSRKNTFFVILSILLVLLGGAAIASIFILKKKNETIPVPTQTSTTLPAEQGESLEVVGWDKDKLTLGVSNRANTANVKPG